MGEAQQDGGDGANKYRALRISVCGEPEQIRLAYL